MKKPLWTPKPERVKSANMTRFISFVNKRCNLTLKDYFELQEWSVARIADFWAAAWDFLDIKASRKFDKVVDDLDRFPGAEWFPGARLNFAENLLRYRDDRPAFAFKCETKPVVTTTYKELYSLVARLAAGVRAQGITKDDRVVGYMPNMTETAIAMLAATSTGAVWASCGSELGVQAVIDRFSQIAPKVLFTIDGYLYNNKAFPMLKDVKAVVDAVPSIEKVVVVPYIGEGNIGSVPKAVAYKDFLGKADDIEFEQVPFSHPVYIMFSSGTTGKPRCIVQSAGGILINHLKELVLHADLKRDDTVTYMTAPSRMMWNWLMAALGVGSKILLFDGNPAYPDLGAMWKLVDDEKITFFGTSAAYINLLKGQDYRPKDHFNLSSLTSMGQTGSPLSAEGFQFVYSAIKADVHFNSLAGGTDINGCFVIGCPLLPVYAGELQGPGLGMKVKAYDEKGDAIYDRQGELVCEAPAPSMPLYFWNDKELERYKESYFGVYPGVWRHGDYVEFYRDTKGATFFGRSDAILNPSGVRIGTEEIYNVVDKFAEVADAVAVGQNYEGDQRDLLFVKLAQGAELSEDLKSRMKSTLRDKASPRHVPALILEAPDLPYTFNMKKAESAITNIVNGRPVTNRDALVNPESLDYFEKVVAELR